MVIEIYYKRGKRHRDDGGPATVLSYKTEWRVNNKRHRLDGPATIYNLTAGQEIEFWVNKIRYNKDNYPAAVEHWLSYRGVTREAIKQLIGNFRIVEWC